MARFQSYGAVLVVDDSGTIRHSSDDCDAVLDQPALALCGQPLSSVIPGVALADLLHADDDVYVGPSWRRAELAGGAPVKLRAFTAAPGLTGVDVVPVSPSGVDGDAVAVERITRWTARMQSARTRAELLQGLCAVVASLSDFEGAWAVRIDDDNSGFVETACVTGGAPDTTGSSVSAINLPPGDPIVAGRAAPFFVADVTEAANDLTPPSAVRLDLSGSALHRPYDTYLDFLASFGVRSTLSIPIIAGGRTWLRLIAHHPTPIALPAATQSELRLVGLAASTRLQELLTEEDAAQRLTLALASAAIMRAVAATPTLAAGLSADPAALLSLCDATSAIIAIDNQPIVIGDPLPDGVAAAVLKDARIKLSTSDDPVMSSTTMPHADDNHAGGYLAMALDDAASDLVTWVRPELRRTVPWVTVEQTGPTVDTQRNISDAVTSELRGEASSSSPWTGEQLQAARTLRSELASIALGRYGALEAANSDLRRSNTEFDAFAHTVAHDLRAPIRGITQYTEFFLEDTAERLSTEEIAQLRTILRLAGRGTDLLDDLLKYAQLGQATWTAKPVNIKTAAHEALEQLDRTATADADIQIADGTLEADPSALRQLFVNLIGNAIKYSAGTAKINVGLIDLADAAQTAPLPATIDQASATAPVLFVQDHGVGIAPEHAPAVFGLFKRANDTLPGVPGTGAGLAMCRRIAQRHGGDIWLTSTPGKGTTIYTLLRP